MQRKPVVRTYLLLLLHPFDEMPPLRKIWGGLGGVLGVLGPHHHEGAFVKGQYAQGPVGHPGGGEDGVGRGGWW